MRIKSLFMIIALLAFQTLLSSCGDGGSERDGKHPLFIRAESLYESGNYGEAAELYQKYLAINPHSAKSCYRLGFICQGKNDYIKAIYFYKKYLDMSPKSGDKDVVLKWIESAREGLYKQLAAQYKNKAARPFASSGSNGGGKVLAEARKDAAVGLAEKDQLGDKKEAAKKKPKTYTVKYGDTLQKISAKFYGSSSYYNLILEANKELIPSASTLRPDIVIKIPPLDKEKKLGF